MVFFMLFRLFCDVGWQKQLDLCIQNILFIFEIECRGCVLYNHFREMVGKIKMIVIRFTISNQSLSYASHPQKYKNTQSYIHLFEQSLVGNFDMIVYFTEHWLSFILEWYPYGAILRKIIFLNGCFSSNCDSENYESAHTMKKISVDQ